MFDCKRCGHEFTTKGNLVTHLKRKYVCKPEIQDLNVKILLDELTDKQFNERTYDCEICKKKFNTYKSKWRHSKGCQIKEENQTVPLKTYNDLKDKFEKAMLRFENHFENKGNLIINNNINNGNQVIQKLRNFGNENMDAVPPHFIRSSLMNLEYATLFENLHCDPEYPENHNIRIKSKKDKELEMFTQDKWKIKSFKNGLIEVMDHLNRIYEDFCKHNYNDLIEDVGEEDAETTLKELETKSKITPDVQKEILHTLEEYRPMLMKGSLPQLK